MDKFVIRPHSIVDIITNSSTVIYTGVTDNAIEAVKGIINEVLQSVGSDKTADDLYLFDVILSFDEETEEENYNLVDQVEDRDFENSIYPQSNIVVRSRMTNTSEVSDLLAEIFYARESYG